MLEIWNKNADGSMKPDAVQRLREEKQDAFVLMQLRAEDDFFDELFASMRQLHR